MNIFQKPNSKVVDRDQIDTLNTHIHDRSLPGLDTCISIKKNRKKVAELNYFFDCDVGKISPIMYLLRCGEYKPHNVPIHMRFSNIVLTKYRVIRALYNLQIAANRSFSHI